MQACYSTLASAAKPAIKPVPKPLAVVPAADAKPVEKRDMFGRIITATNKRKRSRLAANDGGLGEASTPGGGDAPPLIRFKYHEGVTDAVRRTVKVRDLL